MKKVLIIADEFPPVGGAGVQRTLKFTKYLQDFEYMPYIFTRGENNILLKDESMLEEVPENVLVTRTKPYDLIYKNNILHKILYYKLLIPDGRYLWYQHSKNKLIKTIMEVKPDVIYSTSFPYSDHLLAYYAKKKLPELKWVADFRDEWTNNTYFNYNPIRKSIEKNLEEKILKSCDAVITNTPIMGDNFIDSYPFIKNKLSVIPNGFDPDDYKDIKEKTSKNNIFTITYTGSLYGSRNPDPFLKAFAKVCHQGLNIKTTFIGNIKADKIKEIIKTLNIEDNVEFIPYLQHKECIEKLYNGDVSLLIEGKENIPFYTGKVFEYMYLLNPILAVIPLNGAAAELINRTKTGLVCDCEDIDSIVLAIKKLYNDFSDNIKSNDRNTEEINKYHRRNLTQQLVEIFDKLL